MREVIEMMFEGIASSFGFDCWWDTEELWDDIAEIMISAGLDKEEVENFFSELAEEL